MTLEAKDYEATEMSDILSKSTEDFSFTRFRNFNINLVLTLALNRRETTLALCFPGLSEVTGGPNPFKGWQRTCDSSGVAGVHGRR